MSKYFDRKDNFLSSEITEHGSHMIMQNVYKDVKKKYLNIDTRYQENYNLEKYSDVNISMPQSVNNVKSLKMTNIEIPITFYNFSKQRKNTYFVIKKRNDVTKHLIVLPDGNYSKEYIRTGLISEIYFAGLKEDISIDIDANNNIWIENTSESDVIDFFFAVDDQGENERDNFKSKLGWTLGFRKDMYSISPNETLKSESPMILNNLKYVFVALDEFSSSNPNSFISPSFTSYINGNIIARISLDTNTYSFGSTYAASISGGRLISDTRNYGGKTNIQRLRVQLLDERGDLLDLHQNDFSFVLEIEYD